MPNQVFLNPDELARLLQSGESLPVDVRQPYFYAQGHLSGAVSLPLVTLGTVDGRPYPRQAMAERLGALGIGAGDYITLYDDGASPMAASVFWLLEYHGHDRITILNGGITRWQHEGRDIVYAPAERTAQQYTFEPLRSHALAQLEDVRAAIGTPDTVIIDVRTPAEYLGLQPSAARDGHIPTAVNIDWANNLDRGRSGVAQLTVDAELRLLYETAGATKEKDIIVYCQSGSRSSMTYAVLRHLGYPRVRNYAGSWQEWGNRNDTPVSTE